MAQIIGGVHRGHAAGDTNIEKAASQLVSDTKYKVKQRLGDNLNKMAPAALMKAYMEQLSKSPAGPVRALAQKKLTGGNMKENFNIDALASSSVANALFKVFVEGTEKQESVLGEEYLEELMKKNRNGETLYWVKVYYKNGTTYTRWADRSRMSEIRSNPNVESVEMIDSKPPENQRDQSSKKDYDGDGKVESGSKEHAGSVHNAIQRRRGGTPDGKDTSSVKEDVDFFEEDKKKDKKDKKFDVMRGNGNSGRVKLFPETSKVNEEVVSETSYSKFLNMIQEKTLTAAETAKKEEIAKALKSKYGKTPKTYAIATSVAKKVAEETACDSSEPQRDRRGDYAKTNLIKNKLRSALGVKNPIVMVSNEKDVKEGAGLSVGISKAVGNLLSNPRTSPEQGAKNFQKNFADPVGNAVKGALRAVVLPKDMSPEAQKARNNKYRPEEVELEGEMIDERRREDSGTPRKPRDRAVELLRSRNKGEMMTRSGETVAKHEAKRGVKKDRTSEVNPEPPANPPAKKLARKKAEAGRQREIGREMQSSRFD
jgi:hypothetical protein